MAKLVGKVTKFGHKGYGFIEGEDGEAYFAHQKNINGASRLRVGTVVSFEPQDSDKGKVAVNITAKSKPKNNSNGSNTNILLTISFILHAITIYAVFFK
jgi:CspA family cold shock protein